MPIDLAPELLEILACPNCHGSLAVDHDRDELVCLAADCGLAYPVRQGIPVLLIDEARRPGPDLAVGSASSARSASSAPAANGAGSAAERDPVAGAAAAVEAPASAASARETSAPKSPAAGEGDERR